MWEYPSRDAPKHLSCLLGMKKPRFFKLEDLYSSDRKKHHKNLIKSVFSASIVKHWPQYTAVVIRSCLFGAFRSAGVHGPRLLLLSALWKYNAAKLKITLFISSQLLWARLRILGDSAGKPSVSLLSMSMIVTLSLFFGEISWHCRLNIFTLE